MKTLQYLGNASIGLGEKPIPETGPDEVLIKVAYAGICGTDMHIADGFHPRAKAGLTMGHEFSGTVEKAGEKTSFSKGDRVIVEPLISCGVCASCRAGYPHVCQKLGLYGIDRDGGFGEYVKIPAHRVIHLPDGISMVQGALIEPLAVGVHAVRMSFLKSMDTVLIIGGGPIGFFTALAARAAGARVFVAEINKFRRETISSFGFELFDLPKAGDLDPVYAVTDGKGFDIVFDAAGGAGVLQAALEVVKVRGQVVMVAIPPEKREISYVPISFKEVSLVGIRVYEYYDFQRAVRLFLDADIDFSRIYSIFKLDDYKEAFAAAAKGDKDMRVIFQVEAK